LSSAYLLRLAMGPHRLRAVAVDNDQHHAVADVTISALDNVPPIVKLTRPKGHQVFLIGKAVEVTAEASDRGGAVQRVEFYLHKGMSFDAPSRLVGTVTSPPYRLTLRGLKPDHYMITALATDNRGATDQSSPVEFEVVEREE
jgi:hypothetical protein